MIKWLRQLRFDAIPVLLSSGSGALSYFVRRDLLEEKVEPIHHVWKLPEVEQILQKQQPDGSWPFKKRRQDHRTQNYSLFETWKAFRILIEQYELAKAHEEARKAAEFIFSFQSEQGDIRGMLANQYATYYTGAMLADLIRAGYASDSRVEKGLQWLARAFPKSTGSP